MVRCTEDLTQYARDWSLDRLIPACTTPTLQSCVACELVNYTTDSKVDFTIYDYTQELAGRFYSFTERLNCL